MRANKWVKLAVLILSVHFMTTGLYSQELYWTSEFKEMMSYDFQNGSLKLLKKINKNKYRHDAGGSKFYQTTLAVDIEFNGNSIQRVVENDAYTYGGLDKSSSPCMLVDPDRKFISIFMISKSDDRQYGHDGLVFSFDMVRKDWTKEVIFTKWNCGRYAFFGGSNNGRPEIYHFSFAGYYAILSKKESNGTWSNITLGSMSPDFASSQYAYHKNLLVTSYPNVDKMWLEQTQQPKSSASYSDNSNASNSGLLETLAVGAILYGIYSLFSDENSTSSSNSSYNTSASSSNCYMDFPWQTPSGEGISGLFFTNKYNIRFYLKSEGSPRKDSEGNLVRKVYVYDAKFGYENTWVSYNEIRGYSAAEKEARSAAEKYLNKYVDIKEKYIICN